MTANNHFLEIPIYRCTHEAHGVARNLRLERYCGSAGSVSAEARKRLEEHVSEHFLSCWEYNEAIGWLRVFWLDHQLRGEYHLAREKRLYLGGRRTYEACGKAFEAWVHDDATSADIFTMLRKHIAQFAREWPLSGRRPIDTRALERIGPHVDWRSFMEYESKRPTREKLGY